MREWTIVDNTSAKGGYLSVMFEGKRVVDAFPFAKDADEKWVREQVNRIVSAMNAFERG